MLNINLFGYNMYYFIRRDMKIINTILLLLFFSSLAQAINEKVDRRTGYHLGISTMVGYATETVLHQVSGLNDAEKIIYATLPVVVAGVVKEAKDKKSERADVLANIVGAFVGAYAANHINTNYFFKVEHEASLKKTQLTMGYRF